MFLINGLEQNQLPASDRATQFGDGCFTTARIVNGAVSLLDAHIRRLQSACETLLIPLRSGIFSKARCASWPSENRVAY